MTASNLSRLSILVISLSLISCDLHSVEEPGSDLIPSIAIAYGSVTTDSNTPISGAHVIFNIFEAKNCNTSVPDSMLWNAGYEPTNQEGKYRIKGLYMNVRKEKFCVALKVRSPDENEYESLIVPGKSVVFRRKTMTPPVDSVEVNAILNIK